MSSPVSVHAVRRDGQSRRRFLAQCAAVAGIVGVGGCSGGGSNGPRFRTNGGEWSSLSPIESGESHPNFYHGGESTETTNATHDYVDDDTATTFLHRGSDGSDALVLTYDAGGSDTGGRARVEFDESIDPAEHLLVADGPFDRESAETGDTYAKDHFVHDWASGNTDGVVLSVEPFSDPTFEFAEASGLESVRVLSAGGEGNPSVTRVGIDATIEFDF
jgi:hypothetical protein